MKIKMIIKLTYFTLDGKRSKTVPVEIEEIKEKDEIRFPGDVISEIFRLKKQGCLPKCDDSKSHILVSIETADTSYTRLIPYDHIEEYISGSERTFADLGNPLSNNLHMVLGMSTEVGELQDQYKRELAYDSKIDRINTIEEIGDLLWYIANYCRINNISIPGAMERNINKLKTRFPDKFSKESAINRNLEAEMEALTIGEVKNWKVSNGGKEFPSNFQGKNEEEAWENFTIQYPVYKMANKEDFVINQIKTSKK